MLIYLSLLIPMSRRKYGNSKFNTRTDSRTDTTPAPPDTTWLSVLIPFIFNQKNKLYPRVRTYTRRCLRYNNDCPTFLILLILISRRTTINSPIDVKLANHGIDLPGYCTRLELPSPLRYLNPRSIFTHKIKVMPYNIF